MPCTTIITMHHGYQHIANPHFYRFRSVCWITHTLSLPPAQLLPPALCAPTALPAITWARLRSRIWLIRLAASADGFEPLSLPRGSGTRVAALLPSSRPDLRKPHAQTSSQTTETERV